MSQVSAVGRDGLSIGEDPHLIPDNLRGARAKRAWEGLLVLGTREASRRGALDEQLSLRSSPHLLVTEGRPTVGLGLLDEISPRATARSDEKEVSSVGVVEVDLPAGLTLLLEEVGSGPVPSVLSIVAVKVTDAVRRIDVASPTKIRLDGGVRGSVGLRRHHLLSSHHHGGSEGRLKRGLGRVEDRDSNIKVIG